MNKMKEQKEYYDEIFKGDRVHYKIKVKKKRRTKTGRAPGPGNIKYSNIIGEEWSRICNRVKTRYISQVPNRWRRCTKRMEARLYFLNI